MLTPREAAWGQFTVFQSMGRAGVMGLSRAEVDAARLETTVRAESAILRAMAGPAKQFFVEPDDDVLRQMLAAVRVRREELEVSTRG